MQYITFSFLVQIYCVPKKGNANFKNQRLMVSAFSDSLMASGGWFHHPPRSQELQKLWPWNFYHMLVSIRRYEIKKAFDKSDKCKLQTKVLKLPIFKNAISRHATLPNFAGLSKLTSEINPQNLKDWLFYRTICKMSKKAVL